MECTGKKLSGLLRYYQLESDVIHLFKFREGNYSDGNSVDSSTGQTQKCTDEELMQAIDASPWGALSVLASHIGVDSDKLHERVTMAEFQRDSPAVKRVAEEPPEPSGNAELKRRSIGRPLDDRPISDVPPTWSIISEEKQTSLNWEHNTEKFINQLPVHRLRDEPRSPFSPTETQEAGEEEELLPETFSDKSPTPTEIIPSAQLNPQLKRQRSAS